jgi:dTDP-3,4-didehydro-2,6-dideoxy-alpha-D-glucose 3-reductase
MEILVLGFSSVFLRRVLPALNSCEKIARINIASKSKSIFFLKEKIGEKFGTCFDNYSSAINSSCSELVYISLPNHLHFVWAKKSLEHGMHVIVEKPATLNLKDTECLIDLSRKNKLCLAESTVWSFHPCVEFVKNHIAMHKDEPALINACFTVPDFETNNYRNFHEYGGGAFNDLSAYAVSIGRVLFHENPHSVSGKLISFDELKGVDTLFSANMEFSKNRKLTGIFGFGLDYENNLKISGNDFYYELNRVFSPPNDIELNLEMRDDKQFSNQSFKGDAYANFFNSVIKTFNTPRNFEWSEILYQDAKIASKLKSSVMPKNNINH